MNLEALVKLAALVGLVSGAVAAYHNWDLQPMKTSVHNIETSAVVQRISNIYALKCRQPVIDPEIEHILREQLERYHQLTGRTFTAPC